MPLVVGFELLQVSWAAGGIPNGVDEEGKTFQPQLLGKEPGYLDDLGVNGGIGVPNSLDSELVVLAVTPGLRALVHTSWSASAAPSSARVTRTVVVEAVYGWMFDVPLMVMRAASIASGVWAPAIALPATYIVMATTQARTA